MQYLFIDNVTIYMYQVHKYKSIRVGVTKVTEYLNSGTENLKASLLRQEVNLPWFMGPTHCGFQKHFSKSARKNIVC